MGLQARGRARRHKEGLRDPQRPLKNKAPTAEDNDGEVERQTARVIRYLSDQLDILLRSHGCHREVMAIGRCLQQLRSKRNSDPASDDPDPVLDARTLFRPPPQGTA